MLSEFDIFNEKIHKVSLKSRYFAWFFLMIMLIIGLALVYISSFAHLYEPGSDNPFSDSVKQQILFLFFWGGVYSDLDY